jgi:hypothetical protein
LRIAAADPGTWGELYCLRNLKELAALTLCPKRLAAASAMVNAFTLSPAARPGPSARRGSHSFDRRGAVVAPSAGKLERCF